MAAHKRLIQLWEAESSDPDDVEGSSQGREVADPDGTANRGPADAVK